MEDCELNGRTFNFAALKKKISELQENSEKQLNKLINKTNKLKEDFTNEI